MLLAELIDIAEPVEINLNGQVVIIQSITFMNLYLLSVSYQLQFFIVTIHTTYNLYADCDFPDSMNMVVFAYALSLIALFSNFYYQSYLAKKKSKKV